MLAIFFVPLGAPGKDKFHVAPVHDVAIVRSADACTRDRLGDGVATDACKDAVTNGTSVVVTFSYDVRPCGGDRCTTATNIRYSVDGSTDRLLLPPGLESAVGVHSLLVTPEPGHERCTKITAVRLPENASSQPYTECVTLRPVASGGR